MFSVSRFSQFLSFKHQGYLSLIGFYVLSLGAVLFSFLLESIWNQIPGIFVGGLEILLELLALLAVGAVILRSKPSDRRKFIPLFLFFFFIFLADFFYVYYYYLLQVKHPDFIISLLTSVPYGLSFLSLFFFLLLSFERPRFKALLNPIVILPLVILTPIAVRLSLPLFVTVSERGMFFQIVEIVSLVSSYLGFTLSVLVFICSRSLSWIAFSSGPIIFFISDWAIKVEKFIGKEISFVGYEFLWALGVFISCLSVLFIKIDFKSIRSYQRGSIVLNAKLVGCILSFVSVFVIALFESKNTELVKLVSVSASIGVIGAAIFGLFLLEKMNSYNEAVSFALSNAKKTDQSEGVNLPDELSNTYSQVVRSKIKEIHQTQEYLSKIEQAEQIGHDIRSPITALKVASQSLKSLDKDLQNLVKLSADRIEEIAQTVSPGRNEKQTSYIDPIALVTSVLEEKKPIVSEKKIKLDFDNLVYSRVFIKVDSVELKRVLSNLINNSMESILEQGIERETSHILLRMVLDGDEGVMKLIIQDSGKGVDSSLSKKLFDRGVSLKAEGTGLGLYHAREKIQSWGGEIDFNLEVKKGAEIVIRLPFYSVPGSQG